MQIYIIDFVPHLPKTICSLFWQTVLCTLTSKSGEQENTLGNTTLSGTVMLDSSAETLASQIAQNVYNQCRSGNLSLQGFPDFKPLLEGLRQGVSQASQREFKVCTRVDKSLVALQVYAQKFLDDESTVKRATAAITEHNAKYNIDEDFLKQEETASRTAWLTRI